MTTSAQITRPTFSTDITEHTPELVKELVGQPLEHAATVMSLALLQAKLGSESLERNLRTRGARRLGEGPFECAVRIIAELDAKKKQAEAQVKSLELERDETANVLSELELGFLLAGCTACFKPCRSLVQRARDIVAFVKKITVRTTVLMQATTVVVSEPVLP